MGVAIELRRFLYMAFSNDEGFFATKGKDISGFLEVANYS
jgi:hypothetical protein